MTTPADVKRNLDKIDELENKALDELAEKLDIHFEGRDAEEQERLHTEESVKKAVKKPFVPKPHLTDRPFQNNEALLKLKSQLTHPAGKGRKK